MMPRIPDDGRSGMAAQQNKRSLKDRVGDNEAVRLFCNDCGRNRNILFAAIVPAADIEADTPVRQLKHRIRCTRCNGRNVDMMTPSHSIIPVADDRTRRIASNVEGVSCPNCGTMDVSRSCALKKPNGPHGTFLRGLTYEYECEVCGNWWTAP